MLKFILSGGFSDPIGHRLSVCLIGVVPVMELLLDEYPGLLADVVLDMLYVVALGLDLGVSPSFPDIVLPSLGICVVCPQWPISSVCH